MDIYAYSDESGVFDHLHNEYFIFGGLIFLSKADKDNASRKYSGAENNIRKTTDTPTGIEIKASSIKGGYKNKLYKSLHNEYKFCGIIKQEKILSEIWENKKTKQRYLDYAYKRALKNALESLIKMGAIVPNEVENIFVYQDEHTTATNGKYELKESLECEFKLGMYSSDFKQFFPPIFKNLKSLSLYYKDSKSTILIRAADIVANKFYYLSVNKEPIEQDEKTFIMYLPD